MLGSPPSSTVSHLVVIGELNTDTMGTSTLASFKSLMVDLISTVFRGGGGAVTFSDLLSWPGWGKGHGLPLGPSRSENQYECYARC